MAEKDNSTHTRVTVQGQYTSAAAGAGVLHRLYHYHVNILNPEREQPQAYDRVLHIREQGQPGPAVPPPPVETAPLPTDETGCNTIPDTLEKEDPPDAANVTQPPATDIPPPAMETAQTSDSIDLPSVIETSQATPARKPFFRHTAHRRRAICRTLSLTPALKSLQTRLKQARQAMARLLPGIHRRIAFPDLKPSPARRLFNPRSGKTAGKLILIAVCAGLAAALIYIPSPPRITVATPDHKPVTAATDKDKDKDKKAPLYQARIEQQPDGVIITIQGPAYEEVLTRLPPGYQPVVQDNKIIHIVTPGNTLWFIAKRYIKNPYRYPELVRLNHIKNPDLIYPGDKVIIQHIRRPAP